MEVGKKKEERLTADGLLEFSGVACMVMKCPKSGHDDSEGYTGLKPSTTVNCFLSRGELYNVSHVLIETLKWMDLHLVFSNYREHRQLEKASSINLSQRAQNTKGAL